MTAADPFDPTDPDLHAAVRALADAVPPVEPSPGLRDRLLAALPPAGLPGITFKLAADAAFRPLRRKPGVSVCPLHLDRPARRFTCLLRLEPGASLGEHAHDGVEECLILEGALEVAGRTLRPGDYQRAEPGSPHAEQVSPGGCLLFLAGPLSLLAE